MLEAWSEQRRCRNRSCLSCHCLISPSASSIEVSASRFTRPTTAIVRLSNTCRVNLNLNLNMDLRPCEMCVDAEVLLWAHQAVSATFSLLCESVLPQRQSITNESINALTCMVMAVPVLFSTWLLMDGGRLNCRPGKEQQAQTTSNSKLQSVAHCASRVSPDQTGL